MSIGVLRMLILLASIVLASSAPAHAQNGGSAQRPHDDEPLRVFVDCQGFSCDDDYLRTEINFLTFVRDRHDAQVDILITSEQTGAQGTQFTAQFIGQQRFAGEDDSLQYTAPAAQTEDEIRSALVQLLERGLLRYVNHTPLGERMQVYYAPPRAPQQPATSAPHDPWNHWTFSTMLSGAANGEQSASSANINASFSADRTTDDWKFSTSVQAGYSRSTINAGTAGTFTTLQHNYAINAMMARSIGGHWAAGVRATMTSSTYLNQSLTLRLGPAAEYNLFPYDESTRRQFTIQYSVGVTSLDYIEETIFGKMSQRLMDERLLASLQMRQPWGSIGLSAEGSHYLNDFGKRRGIGVANIDVRLFRGLSLVLLGGLELVRDQLFLPKGDATTEELLLQQREQATSFHYFSSIGISFTFGSPFAGVVNSRFAGSSAGTNIIQ